MRQVVPEPWGSQWSLGLFLAPPVSRREPSAFTDGGAERFRINLNDTFGLRKLFHCAKWFPLRRSSASARFVFLPHGRPPAGPQSRRLAIDQDIFLGITSGPTTDRVLVERRRSRSHLVRHGPFPCSHPFCAPQRTCRLTHDSRFNGAKRSRSRSRRVRCERRLAPVRCGRSSRCART